MSWIFLLVSALGAICTLNGLWPLRRPWWLKLPSFNLGWGANELPFHALAGTLLVAAVFIPLGVLDEAPGKVAVVIAAGSCVGLVVLAGADRRAGPAMERALHEGLGIEGRVPGDPAVADPTPRSWLVAPWLVFVRPRDVERVANVVYATVGGRPLKLDVYRHRSRPHNCPVLVEIHGGGWMTGDRRLEARPLMARLAAHGWVCVSVDYRLSRRATWPDHIVDVKTALAWVHARVADYGGDPEFVAVTGGSSGGHLAVLAALTPNDDEYQPQRGTEAQVRACVSFYGVHDFNNSLKLRAAAEMRLFVERPVMKVPQADAAARYEHATPLARVTRNAPPFLLIQGTSDNLVYPAESRAFADRLRRISAAPVVYAEVHRGQHAFDAVASIRTARTIEGVERFLAHTYAVHRQQARNVPPDSAHGAGGET